MNCPHCKSPHTTTEVGAECQIIHACVECDARWNPPAEDEQETPRATVATPQRPAMAPQRPSASLTPRNIIKLSRERLRELDREIKRLESLKKERDEIKRLLAAAKTKQDGRSNLRPLRTANQG